MDRIKYLALLILLPLIWVIQAVIAYYDPIECDDDKVPHSIRLSSAKREMKDFSVKLLRAIKHRGGE